MLAACDGTFSHAQLLSRYGLPLFFLLGLAAADSGSNLILHNTNVIHPHVPLVVFPLCRLLLCA
jgi:hypothetical protein